MLLLHPLIVGVEKWNSLKKCCASERQCQPLVLALQWGMLHLEHTRKLHMWTRNMYEEQGYGSSATPSYPRWSLYALDNQQEESYIFILLLIVELAFNHNRSIVNIIVELWMILHLHGWMSTTLVLLDERWVMHLGEEKHGITNGKRGEGVETPKGHFIHEPRTISI